MMVQEYLNNGVVSSNVTIGLVFILTFLLVFCQTRRRKGVPPGPPLWPVVGNLFSLARKDTLGQLADLRRRYGDVYALYIGQELVVFLNGYDTIHDALVKRGGVFARRPVSSFTKLMLKDVILVFENGITWKEQRRFVLNTLRDLCLKNSGLQLEEKVNEEMTAFTEKLKSFDKPVDISSDINLSLANVIFAILFGKRRGYKNEKLQWYLKTLDDGFKEFARNSVIVNCFPLLCKVPKYPIDLLGIRRNEERTISIKKYYADLFQEHMASYTDGDETCLVDLFIKEVKENTEFSKDNSFTNDNMWILLHDLMAAGSETIATTIKWILLHLIRNPDIQKRLHAEIDSAIGRDHVPSIDDRKNLPYLEATIMEGLRLGHAVPLAVPHSVPHDIVFKGLVIPKDTTILANITTVLRDPNVYPDPETFNPDRFLSKDGKSIVLPNEFVPFSIGPRSCIGESLARIELFLYMATLLQKFEFQIPDRGSFPTLSANMGLTFYPKTYKIKILERKSL